MVSMKKNYILLFVGVCMLCGCQPRTAPTEYVEYADDIEYQTVVMPQPDVQSASVVKYSVPRDSDLTLETRHHIIQIEGNAATPYEYRVWAGDKTYADDPDLIVDDGNIMVLQSE